MTDRTKDQILKEAVYAVACVAHHYGPALNEEGLQEIHNLLLRVDFHTDATYRVDVFENDEFADFHSRIIWPDDWDKITL